MKKKGTDAMNDHAIRHVTHGDAVCLARHLFDLPQGERADVIKQCFHETMVAQVWRHEGKSHPTFGDGSIMTNVLAKNPCAEPALTDPDYALCLGLVYEAIGDFYRGILFQDKDRIVLDAKIAFHATGKTEKAA